MELCKVDESEDRPGTGNDAATICKSSRIYLQTLSNMLTKVPIVFVMETRKLSTLMPSSPLDAWSSER